MQLTQIYGCFNVSFVKVTWFFKNRLIRNSPDYQHVIKGTQYSLYMNESFLDDVGEYMCKAVNEKGTATSKAYLFVKGINRPDLLVSHIYSPDS